LTSLSTANTKETTWSRVNPDCGLKTRGDEETKRSLINLVNAAKEIRKIG